MISFIKIILITLNGNLHYDLYIRGVDENLGNWDSDGQRDQRIRGTCCRVTALVTPRGRWLGRCCRVTLLTFVLCINLVGLRDKGKCCWNKKRYKKYLNQQHTQTHLGNGGGGSIETIERDREWTASRSQGTVLGITSNPCLKVYEGWRYKGPRVR